MALKRTGPPKRRTPLPRPSKPMERGQMKRRPKSPAKWRRQYGSEARVEAIKGMPCTVPGCANRPSENAHVAPKAERGMGYKADARWIAPLCSVHHYSLDSICGSVEVFDATFKTDLRAVARRLAETLQP